MAPSIANLPFQLGSLGQALGDAARAALFLAFLRHSCLLRPAFFDLARPRGEGRGEDLDFLVQKMGGYQT